MKNRILSAVAFVVLGLLTALGPQYIFKVCPAMDGKFMACHWTGRAEIGAGLLIAVLGLLLIFFSSKEIRLGLSISLIASAINSALIPSVLIGVCGMTDMQCHALTYPALLVLAGLTALIAVINAVYLIIALKKKKS